MAEVVTKSVSGAVLTLTINRPDAGNRINADVHAALAAAWAQFNADSSLKVAILTGAGAVFSEGEEGVRPALSGFPSDSQVWKPVVLAVNGRCAGTALRLMGEADIVVVSESAVFAGAPLTQHLPFEELVYQRRRLPTPLAELLVFSGGSWTIDGARAYETGWASEIAASGDLLAKAGSVANAVAQQNSRAVQLTKEAIVRGRDVFTRDAVEQGRALIPPLAYNEEAKALIVQAYGG